MRRQRHARGNLGPLAAASLAAAWLAAAWLAAACGDNVPPDDAPCRAGFVEDGGACADVDECAAADACDARATCTNTEGSFTCACPAGWDGDGTTCRPAPCIYDYVEGHGDMYASWDDAAGLTLRLRSELEPGMGELAYDPWAVCIRVPRARYDEVAELGGRPPGPGWDPVGVPAGQAFWYLPELPVDGSPWFGVASDDTELGGVPAGTFGERLTLAVEVERPAEAQFSAWSTVDDPEAPPFVISTATGRSAFETITGSHAHLSWAFTRPGEYFVRATVSGVLAATGEVRASAPVTFRFVVEE